MRISIQIDDALVRRARQEAAGRGETLTSLIENGLRLALAQPTMRTKRPAAKLAVCKKGGDTLPTVDIGNSASLLDRMEGIQ